MLTDGCKTLRAAHGVVVGEGVNLIRLNLCIPSTGAATASRAMPRGAHHLHERIGFFARVAQVVPGVEHKIHRRERQQPDNTLEGCHTLPDRCIHEDRHQTQTKAPESHEGRRDTQWVDKRTLLVLA